MKLDEEFRDAKIWFRDLVCAEKENKIEREVKRMGISLSDREIREALEISEEEDNPFFSNR